MKKLNVGLVGAGFMGKAHVVGYSNMPKFFWPAPAVPVMKTICDIVPEIAEDARERFGFEKCCTDWREIVNDPEIDVVSICTPNNAHAEIAIAALKAGKHEDMRNQLFWKLIWTIIIGTTANCGREFKGAHVCKNE